MMKSLECRISAVVLKSGKENQYEIEGYGQVDFTKYFLKLPSLVFLTTTATHNSHLCAATI